MFYVELGEFFLDSVILYVGDVVHYCCLFAGIVGEDVPFGRDRSSSGPPLSLSLMSLCVCWCCLEFLCGGVLPAGCRCLGKAEREE